jgi:hypothetical protein
MNARWRSSGPVFGALLLAGCLSPEAVVNTSDIALATESSDASSSAGEVSTYGEIMTTTEDPDGTSGTASDDSTGSGETTSTPIPVDCGDGELQTGEECDEGPNNADDGACTSACKAATCGDGHVWAGMEACDDGVNDGGYGGCTPDCAALGPYCGDGTVQAQEACDNDDPKTGCLRDTCTLATSCLEIKQVYGNEVVNGIFKVQRNDKLFSVYCDMFADGGGYTFLKMSITEVNPSAKKAEAACAGYGMKLLAPRTQAHLASAHDVAAINQLTPLGGGPSPVKKSEYLQILGIYPVADSSSCPGDALNDQDCPEWAPKGGGRYWLASGSLDPNEPTFNCLDCSMLYKWTEEPDPVLFAYEAQKNFGDGAMSPYFLCDVGDKK